MLLGPAWAGDIEMSANKPAMGLRVPPHLYNGRHRNRFGLRRNFLGRAALWPRKRVSGSDRHMGGRSGRAVAPREWLVRDIERTPRRVSPLSPSRPAQAAWIGALRA